MTDVDGSDHADGAGHYFSERPATGSRPSTVRFELTGRTVEVRTDRGVFSATRLDPGTRVLLDSLDGLDDLPDGDLVDVGCGWGPIALSLAELAPGRRVVAVDVNERARALCAENASLAGLDVVVRDPDDLPDDLRVAGIVSNPPIRVGKAVLHQLLTDWLPRLVPGGTAWLVVQRHLGADSLADWLAGQGWQVTRVRSRKGYRVLRVGPA